MPSTTSTAEKLLRAGSNAAFLFAFVYLFYPACQGLLSDLTATARGGGFLEQWRKPWSRGEYHECVLAVIWLAISLITVWEVTRVLIQALRVERSASGLFGRVARTFKPTFLAALVGGWLPRLLALDLFWPIEGAFRQWAPFEVPLTLWGWLYGLLAWDLATWVYHFTVHRVRLLWCMHAPHHAPVDLTITTAWVHFFAEGWFTTTIQLAVLTLLGVPKTMLVVFIAFEVSWGTLIHSGERIFRSGRLGPLRFLIITPSYHRVHHAKNPLYIDTNFCTLLPFWDYVFGTLQPLRDEVPLVYGVTRPVDVTKFHDFYFGEFVALARDLRAARSWRERLQYLYKPPGWSPTGDEHTAARVRGDFLARRPELAVRGWRGMGRRSALVRDG